MAEWLPFSEPAARLAEPVGPQVRMTRDGLYLPEADLWLDPLSAKDAAFISHAHSDHARPGHGLAIATPATHMLMELRNVGAPGPRLEYGEVFERNGCRLWLISAGHVLGSAQLVCETSRGRLIYTGDCKLRRSRTAGPPADVLACDTLITEATFALPIFRFPPAEAVEQHIVTCARDAIAAGDVPVFLAYSLGKGPEVARILADGGVPVRVWGSITPILRIYEQFGIRFDDVLRTTAEAPLEGMAMVIPPSARLHPGIAKIKNRQVIYCSGWALLDSGYDRMDADHLIPISDHFDWMQIEEYVTRAAPRRVLATHGYTDALARVLRQRGLAAEAVTLNYGEEED